MILTKEELSECKTRRITFESGEVLQIIVSINNISPYSKKNTKDFLKTMFEEILNELFS